MVVLLGVVFNGRAGILREKDDEPSKDKKGSMLSGIMIAVIGGVLATAFSYANTIGKESLMQRLLAIFRMESIDWCHECHIRCFGWLCCLILLSSAL